MKKIILIAFLFINLFSFGQNSNDKVVYLDSLKQETKSDYYTFKKIIKEYHLTKEIYTLEIYNDNNTLIYAEEISDKDLETSNGAFTSYYVNGNKIKSGFHTNNKLSGKLTEWYENGNMKAEYFYELKNNENQRTIINFWNEDNIQTVKDGEGDYLVDIGYKNETVILRGKVKNKLMDGRWTTAPNEFPYYEEYYKNGEFLNGVKKYPNNTSNYYTEIYKPAEPIGGINNFRSEIGRKIKTKKQKTSLVGKVESKFTVNSNGEIVNPIISISLNEYFDTQLINLLKESEKWEPAVYRGEKIESSFRLPLKIEVTD